MLQPKRGARVSLNPLFLNLWYRKLTLGLGCEKDIDKLEDDPMKPDQIIEGTAAEMGCFSQENGTLGWSGGAGG